MQVGKQDQLIHLSDGESCHGLGVAFFDENHKIFDCDKGFSQLLSGQTSEAFRDTTISDVVRVLSDGAKPEPFDPLANARIGADFCVTLEATGRATAEFRATNGDIVQISAAAPKGHNGTFSLARFAATPTNPGPQPRHTDSLDILSETIPTLIAYIDLDERFRYTHRRYSSLGQIKDPLVGKKMAEVLNPELYAAVRPHIRTALDGHVTTFEVDAFLNREKRRLRLTYAPDFDENGAVKGFFSVDLDITRLKEAHARQKRSEDNFRTLIETSIQGIFIHRDGELLYANQAFAAFYEVEPEDLIGKQLHEIARTPTWAQFQKFREENKSGLVELVTETWSGKILHLECVICTVEWDGAPARLLAAVDISERKNAEALGQRQDAILVHLNEALAFSDYTGKIIAVNPAFERLFGYTPAELLGRPMQAFWRDVHVGPYLFDEIKTGLRSKGFWHGESRIKTKSGAIRYVDSQAVVVKDNHGDAVGRFTVTRDITGRKRAEEATRRQALVLEQLWDGVIIIGADGVVLNCNLASSRIFGAPEDRIIGRDAREIFADQIASPEHLSALEVALNNRAEWTGELEITNFSGADKFIDVQLRPITDSPDNMISAVCVIRDITDKKATEAQLFQAQKMETVGQLTGGIAHDFNNLLAVIQGNLDMLTTTPATDAKAQDFTEAALRATDQGATLVRRLLAFSRKQILRPRAVDVDALITDFLELLTRSLGKDITIRHLGAAPSTPIRVDPTQLENALLNLALNARDAMPKGGRLTIETRLVEIGAPDRRHNPPVPDGRYLEITVSDEGIGIAEDQIDFIFEPFYTTKEAGMGTGLGLSMVYGFVTQSGGAVEATSRPGQGTQIKMLFPCLGAALDTAQLSEPSAAFSLPAIRKKSFLIVEDHAEAGAAVKILVQSLGHNATLAFNGTQALDLNTQPRGFDMALIDIMLPGTLGGIELAAKLREQNPDLLIVFTSGHPDSQDHVPAGELVLMKPYSVQQLADKIARAWACATPTDAASHR